MINENGKIAPAPWVPYTRAGCDFGAVATANTILENTGIDVPTVFGAGLAGGDPGRRRQPRRRRDTGLRRLRRASASTAPQGSALCGARTTASPTSCPTSPGGYTGFNGLFGAKYVDPQIGTADR